MRFRLHRKPETAIEKEIMEIIEKNGKLFSFFPVYLAAFVLVERVIPVKTYHVMHCALDDSIPFCEYFVIPYLLWIVLDIGVAIYTYRAQYQEFERLVYSFILGSFICFAIFLLYPSCQNLRPVLDADKNFFSWVVSIIYFVDTNTNVFPSMHIIGSMILLFCLKRVDVIKKRKLPMFITYAVIISICLSTVLLKQHSVIDVAGGFVVSYIIWFVYYSESPIKKELLLKWVGLRINRLKKKRRFKKCGL